MNTRAFMRGHACASLALACLLATVTQAQSLNLLSRDEVRNNGTYAYYARGNSYPSENANYVTIQPFTKRFYPGPPHNNNGTPNANSREGTLIDESQLANLNGNSALPVAIKDGELADAPLSTGTTDIGGYVGNWVGTTAVSGGAGNNRPGTFDILFDLGAVYRVKQVEIVYYDAISERIASVTPQEVYTAVNLANPSVPTDSDFTLLGSAYASPTVTGDNMLTINGDARFARYVDLRLAVGVSIPGTSDVSWGARIREIRINQEVALAVNGPDATLVASDAGAQNVRVEVNAGEAVAGRQVVVELRDYQSASPVLATGSVVMPAQAGPQVVQVPINVPDLGLYDLTVRVKEGEVTLSSETTTYAAVPPRTSVGPAEFGTCLHPGSSQSISRVIDLVKQAGIARVRTDLFWSNIEKTPGVFTFPSAYDDCIDMAYERGLAPLGILAFGNHVGYPMEFSDSTFPNTEYERALYAEYARQCVLHYGSKVKQWEIWNEPQAWGNVAPAGYVPLLQAAYPVIKATDSTATVISCGGGGAGGGPSGDYEDGVIANGGLDDQDAFSIHPYMCPHDPDWGYVPVNSAIPRVSVPVVWSHLQRFVAARPKSNGQLLGVWVTEIGWHTSTQPNGVSELMQAAYYTRTYLLSRRWDTGTVKGVFWYDFQDDGSNPTSQEDCFGLIRADFSPKPAFVAASVLTWTLGSRLWTQDLGSTSTATIYQYGDNTHPVIAAWTSDNSYQTVSIPLTNGAYTIRDWQGRDSVVMVTTGTLTLPIDANPKYVLKAINLLSLSSVRSGGTYTYYARGNSYPVGNSNYVPLAPFSYRIYPGPPHYNYSSSPNNNARDGALTDLTKLANLNGGVPASISIESGELTDAPSSVGTTGTGGYVGNWVGVTQVVGTGGNNRAGTLDVLFDLGAIYEIRGIEIVYMDGVSERIATTVPQEVYTAVSLANPAAPNESDFAFFDSVMAWATGTNLLTLAGTAVEARFVDIRIAANVSIPETSDTSWGPRLLEVRILGY